MGGRPLEGLTMVGKTLVWKEELERWLKPFLDRLAHKARRRMCPLYVAGLIGPGERKSIQPMAERLVPGDYDQLHHFVAAGVWDAAPLETELLVQADRLAKAGFGAVKTPYDYVPLVADARAAGLITTCHTGGSSIPGSSAITGDHLLEMHPHVSFHINGGPTAMPDADFERVIRESEIALQVCTAGNLRTTLMGARLAAQHGAFDRFIIATDTPTGSGIMPLGMLYTIAHLASLTDMTPERFVCAASGSNARIYGLDSGLLAPGKAADIVLIDAPDGGTQASALAAIRNGDIAAVGAVIAGG